MLLGQLHTAQGDFDLAAECLEEALEYARRGDNRHYTLKITSLLVELDLLRGSRQSAMERFNGVLDLANIDESDTTLTSVLPFAAWAELECGHAARAASLANAAVKRAVEEHAAVELLMAQRVAGAAAAEQQEWDTATQMFEDILALARQLRHPYAQGRTLYEWGSMLAARGDQVGAQARLAEAEIVFERIGARPYLERSRALLSLGCPEDLSTPA
jgi:tetratricopeptide (TPR) repeat protein